MYGRRRARETAWYMFLDMRSEIAILDFDGSSDFGLRSKYFLHGQYFWYDS